jgi:hypothetical protein
MLLTDSIVTKIWMSDKIICQQNTSQNKRLFKMYQAETPNANTYKNKQTNYFIVAIIHMY